MNKETQLGYPQLLESKGENTECKKLNTEAQVVEILPKSLSDFTVM